MDVRRWRDSIAVVGVLALVPVSGAHATHDPAPGTPQRLALHVDNFARSQARTLDVATNLAYQRRVLPLVAAFAAGGDPTFERVTVDPFLAGWDPQRGRRIGFGFFNHYGARLSGHLFLAHGVRDRRRLPAVLLVPGFGAYEQIYWGLAQGLAEAGYLVMTIDPQGQGQSDRDPHPRSRYCDPDGSWRRPQEMGLREPGACAGQYPAVPSSLLDALPALLAGPLGGGDLDRQMREAERLYERLPPNAVFAALDGIAWLLSPASGVADRIDRQRVGVAGHSLGAHGALLAGNGDPRRRFAAVVAWDNFGGLPARVAPRVPTMFQSQDLEQAGPFTGEVDPDVIPSARIVERFAASGVDTMLVPLRGSTHFEWTYIPERQLNPVTAPVGAASRHGERVALSYTRAWLDRYLHPRTRRVPAAEVERVRAATRRLTACTFDDSIDGSSLGVGHYDAATGANRPYRIAGLTVDQQVAYRFRSSWSLSGLRGEDLRHTCGAVAPPPRTLRARGVRR